MTAPPAAPGDGPFRPEYPIRTARPLLRPGFGDLGLHRVEAHLVQSEFVKNEWTDELSYAILRSEWEARQSPG